MSIEKQFENMFNRKCLDFSQAAYEILDLFLDSALGSSPIDHPLFTEIFPSWNRSDNYYDVIAVAGEDKCIIVKFNLSKFKMLYDTSSSKMNIVLNPQLYGKALIIQEIVQEGAKKIDSEIAKSFTESVRYGKKEEIFEEFKQHGKYYIERISDGDYNSYVEHIPIKFPEVTCNTMCKYLSEHKADLQNVHIL